MLYLHVFSVFAIFGQKKTTSTFPSSGFHKNSNSNSLLQVTCNKSLCIQKQEIQVNKGHKSVQESIISVIHVYYHHNI